MSDIIAISHFQQSADGYCLPACVRMILYHLGIECTEAEISRTIGAKPYGTPSYAVQKLAGSGLRVMYREWSISELLAILAAGHPVIVFGRTGFLDFANLATNF